ncbi:hypothetical protein FA15DRAFT_711644 [Coprinopsis marcescibilis]|uniref:Uncharacterized protein n=1 Tax=Coprinopsis marcescibilis TaxID=230819 RepID=A0A5C3K975_COPMA|nr:hypothetical protein FA15DRAFT_711644 [Coprinopsis marcescibilis]
MGTATHQLMDGRCVTAHPLFLSIFPLPAPISVEPPSLPAHCPPLPPPTALCPPPLPATRLPPATTTACHLFAVRHRLPLATRPLPTPPNTCHPPPATRLLPNARAQSPPASAAQRPLPTAQRARPVAARCRTTLVTCPPPTPPNACHPPPATRLPPNARHPPPATRLLPNACAQSLPISLFATCLTPTAHNLFCCPLLATHPLPNVHSPSLLFAHHLTCPFCLAEDVLKDLNVSIAPPPRQQAILPASSAPPPRQQAILPASSAARTRQCRTELQAPVKQPKPKEEEEEEEVTDEEENVYHAQRKEKGKVEVVIQRGNRNIYDSSLSEDSMEIPFYGASATVGGTLGGNAAGIAPNPADFDINNGELILDVDINHPPSPASNIQ